MTDNFGFLDLSDGYGGCTSYVNLEDRLLLYARFLRSDTRHVLSSSSSEL